MNTLRATLHPEGYHGKGRKPPFFEGWYFKIVDAAETHRYAIIPGISLGEHGDGPHSFIQILEGVTGETVYRRYPVDAFTAAETRLEIAVGPNRFSSREMHLDLRGTDIPLQGTVRFGDLQPWPVTWASPGIMGWYAWVPRMECYHGVLSLNHTLAGHLKVNGSRLDFGGGRGYIEKDWGQSFPSGWIWMQTNHFGMPGISLTASIAMIPWIGYTFPGFIVGLLVNGTLYRFATYTGAVTRRLEVLGEVVDWTIEDALYRLRLVGHRATSGRLRGPSKVDMGRPVPETMNASVDVTLTAQRDGTELFRGTGRYAGMEIAGELTGLLA